MAGPERRHFEYVLSNILSGYFLGSLKMLVFVTRWGQVTAPKEVDYCTASYYLFSMVQGNFGPMASPSDHLRSYVVTGIFCAYNL